MQRNCVPLINLISLVTWCSTEPMIKPLYDSTKPVWFDQASRWIQRADHTAQSEWRHFHHTSRPCIPRLSDTAKLKTKCPTQASCWNRAVSAENKYSHHIFHKNDLTQAKNTKESIMNRYQAKTLGSRSFSLNLNKIYPCTTLSAPLSNSKYVLLVLTAKQDNCGGRNMHKHRFQHKEPHKR